jgi:hypothetical protein
MVWFSCFLCGASWRLDDQRYCLTNWPCSYLESVSINWASICFRILRQKKQSYSHTPRTAVPVRQNDFSSHRSSRAYPNKTTDLLPPKPPIAPVTSPPTSPTVPVTCPLVSVTVSPTSPTVLLTASPNCPTASATPPTAPSLLVEVELPEPQSEDEVVELMAVESEMLVSQAAVEEEAQPPRSSVCAYQYYSMSRPRV